MTGTVGVSGVNPNAAAKASNVMSDGRTSKTSKSGAASALSQAARKAIKKT